MPSRTTSVSPSAVHSSRNASSASASSSILSAIVSQPRRSVTSGVPGGAHSVPSRSQMRRATCSSCARLTSSASGASVSGGRSASIAAGRWVTIASRLRSMPSSSLAIGTRNASMPSRSSLSVTSSRSMPASRRASRSAVGSSAAVAPVTSPCWRAAISVGSGIVLTVSRPRQPVDVERLRVLRVLDAGRGPQRALDRGAGVAQGGEALALEHVLERAVGGARVGEPRAAREVGAAGGLEALVDLGVDARDEERRDRVAVERLALLVPALHRVHERLHHPLVGGDREEQRDVDVQPLVERLLDRRDARVGGRDLDHHVGAIDQAPVLARLLERALGVVGEPRRDLERHVAVLGARLVVDRTQHVARELHVLDRHPAVDLACAEPLAGERLELGVVVRRAEDRLLEDRRIRRHAAQRVLLDHAPELARVDRAAPDLVEPHARPGRGQRGEALVDLLHAHGLALPSPFWPGARRRCSGADASATSASDRDW